MPAINITSNTTDTILCGRLFIFLHSGYIPLRKYMPEKTKKSLHRLSAA
jgi:hypothetical protein